MTKKSQSALELLQEHWYKKLEDNGFYDIERHEIHFRKHEYASNDKYGRYSREWQLSKVAYYDMATKFLNEYKFESNLDHIIWEYHTNGIGVRDIAKTLDKVNLKKTAIGDRLKRLKDIMKAMYLVK